MVQLNLIQATVCGWKKRSIVTTVWIQSIPACMIDHNPQEEHIFGSQTVFEKWSFSLDHCFIFIMEKLLCTVQDYSSSIFTVTFNLLDKSVPNNKNIGLINMTKVIDWTILLLIDENEWLNGSLIELLIDWLKCYYETFNVKYHCNLVALFLPIIRHLNTQWHNFTIIIVYPYILEWNLWLLQYVGLKVKIKKQNFFSRVWKVLSLATMY